MSHAQAIPPSSTSPTVLLHNGRPATTSLEVATFFGKRHDNVLQDIRNLFNVTPEAFRLLNFQESSYTNEQGKEQPMFTLYRDGFMLLVMGYTGKKAMQIKIAYIEAFNLMEKELAEQKALPPSPGEAPLKLTPSTSDDRKPLYSLLSTWATLAGVGTNMLRAQVRAHFRVNRLEDVPVETLPEVLNWIQAHIEALPCAAKSHPAIPPLQHSQARNTPALHILTSGNFSEDRCRDEGLIGLAREEKFERIAQRIENVRARTAEEIRGICWDLMLLLKMGSQRCSVLLSRNVSQILYDDIVVQITASTPMDNTPEHNPVLFIRELNKALQE